MGSIVRHAITAVLVAIVGIVSARTEEFPNRPITIMVGLAAGGITDVTARL